MTVPGRTVPPPVGSGDLVAVVAPSGPVDPDRVDRGLAVLRSWGLVPTVGTHLFDRDPGAAYLAGTDAGRAADLQEAWCDPRVRAVLCARGGYGAGRLLDLIDWAALARAGPRLLVGSSDVTALHSAVGRRLGLVTLFGPMAATELLAGSDRPEPRSAAALRASLAAPGAVELAGDRPAIVGGVAEGRLAGGTLSLLAAAVGTPDPPDLDGAVLFCEDVGESSYRLDRLWEQLRRSGALSGVVGVALGSFADCGPDGEATMRRLAAGLGVPVLAGLAVGHGPVQLSVPLGVRVRLDADAGTLTAAGR
jgi:muramoyltetrapeptide carboxypeptidase